MWEIVSVYLRLVGTYSKTLVEIRDYRLGLERLSGTLQDIVLHARRTCAHDPLAVITDSYALARLFEFEVL